MNEETSISPANEPPGGGTGAPENARPEAEDDGLYIYEDASAPADRPMGFLGRFVSIFAAPGRLAENIRAYPKVLQPFVMVLLLAVPAAVLAIKALPIITNAQSVALAERYGVDFVNLSQSAAAFTEQSPVAVFLSGWLGGAATFLFSALVGAAVMKLLTKITGGEGSFRQYFSLFMHTAVISSVVSIISVLLQIATQSSLTFTSLAPIFMPRGSFLDPMYMFFSVIELSGIWCAVVLGIAVKKFNPRFSTFKAAVLTFIDYALGVAFAVGTAVISVSSYDAMFNSMQMMQ